MAVKDHGLEALKKAAKDISGNGSNYALQIDGTITAASSPFAPPSGTDFIGRSVASNVETFEYRQGGSGGTLLKTVTVTYVASDLEELVSVEVA